MTENYIDIVFDGPPDDEREPQGEPSAGNLDHYTDPDDPFWQSRPEPVPQGEPSDAHFTREFDDYRDSNPGWHTGAPYEIALSFWLAALRAAGVVGHEGESDEHPHK